MQRMEEEKTGGGDESMLVGAESVVFVDGLVVRFERRQKESPLLDFG